MRGEPVFIGGMYKSGTSLLRAMLGRHSRMFAGLETQWLYESWINVDADKKLWLDRLSRLFVISIDDLESACSSALNVETALDQMMQALAKRAGKSRWIEKTPGNAGVIDRILNQWPQACILHIIRDPRDVYASLLEINKWATPHEFVTRWGDTIGAARAWLERQGGVHPAYYELRYERLVTTPEDEMRNLLIYLAEPWEPQVAQFSGQPEDFERVLRATGKESSTLKRLAEPLTKTRIGVWQHTVSAKQWEAVRAELARRDALELADTLVAETDSLMQGLMGNTNQRVL